MNIHFTCLQKYQPTESDERFEALLLQDLGHLIDKHFYSTVAGVSFKNDDGSSRQKILSECRPCELLTLVREPGNPYDPNAIRVQKEDGRCLGHLNAHVAEELASDMKYGQEWMCMVRRVTEREPESRKRGLVIVLLRLALPDK